MHLNTGLFTQHRERYKVHGQATERLLNVLLSIHLDMYLLHAKDDINILTKRTSSSKHIHKRI